MAILFSIICVGLLHAEERTRDGEHKTYYDTGEINTEENYLNGKRQGISKVYDKKGRVITKVKFKEGVVVRAFSAEPERNLGKFGFLKGFTFWALIIIVSFIVWRISMKVLFKSRPF